MEDKSGDDRFREFVEKLNQHKSPEIRAIAARDAEAQIKKIEAKSKTRLQGQDREWDEEEKMREMAWNDLYIKCEHDGPKWEMRLKKESCKLKEVIEWISDPREWGNSCFAKRSIPNDMEVYKQRVHEAGLTGIKEGRLKAVYDAYPNDHYVILVQVLLFFEKMGFVLPIECRTFLWCVQRDELALSVKNKKPKIAKRKSGIVKERSDQAQINRFIQIVRESISKVPPTSYDELFERPEIADQINSFTSSKGKLKEYDPTYLKRKISRFMPELTKKPGRRKKINL